MKVRIDGKKTDINIDLRKLTGAREALRLIELRLLYPDRVIKHVEVDGRQIPPEDVVSPLLLKRANIVTEPSVDFVRKHIEISIFALESVPAAAKRIASEWYEKGEVSRINLSSLLSSVDWTVKVFERGSSILPIVEGADEAVLSVEEAILKADELSELDEDALLEFLDGDFIGAVLRWKEFLRDVVKLITKSSMENH